MSEPVASVERDGRAAVVRLQGDLIVPTARALYSGLQDVARRRGVSSIVLDFGAVGRIDSSGVAAVSLIGRQAKRSGKRLELRDLEDRHRAAFAMVSSKVEPGEPVEVEGAVELVGGSVIAAWDGAKALSSIVKDASRQAALVIGRRKRLPAGSVAAQIVEMGFNGLFIVSVLSFLIGITMAFQGVTQLERFGAGVFVADMLSLSMVRELAPLMTAIMLAGRTGAAIAAELGTMKVRSEIDALATMGISPNRFLILPRLVALTFAGPALTLIAMFIGMFGGMLVAGLTINLPAIAYWQRVAEFVTLGDYAHGLIKSVLFSWIIAISGSHFGMRATGDPSSVGQATTRTVVVSVLLIIFVDATFATLATVTKGAG